MKAKGLVFALFMLLCASAHGETRYGEWLSEGTQWCYRSSYVNHNFTLEGSNTLNGKIYGLLHLQFIMWDGARGKASSNDRGTTISIRDEGGRVYVDKQEYLDLFTQKFYWNEMADGDFLPYETTEDGELVLYDFNKGMGDVYCHLSDGTPLTVTETFVMKTEDGMTRRCLTLSNGLELIEGVGCINSGGMLLFWLNTKPDYGGVGLLTFFRIKTEEGNSMDILAQDFDATINQRKGQGNKMLTENRRWVYDYDDGQTKGTFTYYIDGDTLLYAYKRAKVYMKLVDKQTNEVVRSGYAGAFHEKKGILCFLAPESREDVNLYDFAWKSEGKKEFDGVWRYAVNNDVIEVNGNTFYRLLMLNWGPGEDIPTDKESLYYWVDGIGSMDGLLRDHAGEQAGSLRFVACYDGETCIFTADDFLRESTQPIKYEQSLRIGKLSYYVDLPAGTASVGGTENTPNNVVIPSTIELWGIDCTVNSISGNAFRGKTNISSVEIPESVSEIGEYAFEGCTGLTSIEIPESVNEIGIAAFWKCSGLTSIALPSGLVTIENGLVAYCTSLKSISLPNTLQEIKRVAFAECTSLTTLDIPAGVDTIGNDIFWNCINLTDVYCRATTPPNAVRIIRGNTNPELTLHVPAASLQAYKVTAHWSKFNNIVAYSDEQIYFNVEKIDPSAGIPPVMKNPPLAPTVLLVNGNVLEFQSEHPAYTLNIVDNDGNTLFTTEVTESLMQVELPFNLTKDMEVNLLQGSWRIFGRLEPDYETVKVNGINNHPDSPSAPVYDLQGRRIQGEPVKKGVYLRGGKKYVRK